MDYAQGMAPIHPANKRVRTIQACARCRRQKLKCDGEAPCSRCTRLRVVCKHVDEEAAAAAASSSNLLPHSHPARIAVDAQLQHALARIAHLEASVGDIQRRIGDNSDSTPSSHTRRGGGAGAGTGNDSSSGQSSMLFPAPFTEVAFDKVSLENRQVTRANSPNVADDSTNGEGAGGAGRQSEPKDARMMNALNISSLVLDPIESGVVDEVRGQYLLDFYMAHCYSYLPFFESESPVSLRHLQKMDGFLMAAMLAVASRYAESHTQPQSDSSKMESEQLCQLAEAHLGATLVKSRHRLGDVQAVIMLHAWSLRSGGKGSDPWILSGHAFRLAKRLSIDQVSANYRHSDEHRAARRTWLLLCASDCFPSLGFGRPASPRENLESCAKIVKELTDLFIMEGIDIGCEAFIACQVELASISRQLLDWVTEATRRIAKPGMVWERYSSLKQQVDDCDRLWDTPRVGGHEQRRSARLFRLHIKLCLATFALRLSKSASSVASGLGAGSEIGRSSQYSGSPASVVTTEQPFERDRHRSYRRASMEAIYDMIIIQGQEPCLAFVPDYLVTALGQAVIAFIGLLEDEVDEEGGEEGVARSYYHNHAASLVHSALRTLSHFEGSRTGLATFLSNKIRERMERSHLSLTSESASSKLPSMGSHTRQPQQQQQPQHHSPYHSFPHHYHQHRGSYPSVPRQAMPLPLANMPNQMSPSPTVMNNQQTALAHWADPDPQWGDFSQWWDNDDPLRLLFGSGADALNWAPSMQPQPPPH